MRSCSYGTVCSARDERTPPANRGARPTASRLRAGFVLALLIAAFAGCSEPGSSGAEPSDDEDDSEPAAGERTDGGTSSTRPDAGNGGADTGAAPAPTEGGEEPSQSLVGSYAGRITYRDVISVGVAGTASMVTTVLATAEIREDSPGDAMRLDITFCSTQTGDTPEKHLPDLVMTMSSESLSAIEFESPTFVASELDGELRWETTEARAAAGWEPSATSDELPADANDPRIFDEDEDGFPGVSATYSGESAGALYLAMSYRFLFAGTRAENGELVGTTTSHSSELLLGSSEVLLTLTGAMFVREPDPDTADNTVRFIPQSRPLTCEQLIAQESTLFR